MTSLDRPIWQALCTRQAEFATGNDLALRYDAEVSPFAAAADDGAAALAALADLIPAAGSVLLLQRGDCPAPPGTREDMRAEGLQMVAERLAEPRHSCSFVDLTAADAPEMRELALLTRPGPFLPRTHELGQFIGVREHGRLVAMAGERMKLPGHTEVSGICTHPDFRGRGLAGALTCEIVRRVAARGEIPFLHVYAKNETAIRLYRSLGFMPRATLSVVLLRCA